jgi:hypothetical protein
MIVNIELAPQQRDVQELLRVLSLFMTECQMNQPGELNGV